MASVTKYIPNGDCIGRLPVVTIESLVICSGRAVSLNFGISPAVSIICHSTLSDVHARLSKIVSSTLVKCLMICLDSPSMVRTISSITLTKSYGLTLKTSRIQGKSRFSFLLLSKTNVTISKAPTNVHL